MPRPIPRELPVTSACFPWSDMSASFNGVVGTTLRARHRCSEAAVSHSSSRPSTSTSKGDQPSDLRLVSGVNSARVSRNSARQEVMDRLSLTVLGGFQAQLPSGRVLSLPSRKARALLAYLALTPGQAHPRDKLAALLWGDSTDERPRH